MKKIISRLFNFFYYRYLILTNPAEFAKKIGVNVKGKLYIYGATTGMFGSEPCACSLVNKDIPDNSVYAGVPAKFIKSMDDYLEKCQKESLGLGHLVGEAKAKELKKIFLK